MGGGGGGGGGGYTAVKQSVSIRAKTCTTIFCVGYIMEDVE